VNLFTLAGVAPVRYALVFALFSSFVMGVLLAVIYWWVSSLLERHLDEGIEAQLQVLRAALEQDGRDSMAGLVRHHQENYPDSPLHFLLQDRSGAVLAGDLPPTEVGEGWHDIALLRSGADFDDRRRLLRGRGEWLDEDLFVLVTNDTRDVGLTRMLILRSFAIALGATVALALGGGFVIGRVLLQRVEAVNRTARAIMEGDLSQRIPMAAGRDELGGLAESLNRMLGRIEELMANLQDVTSNIAHDLRTPLGRLRQHLEASRVKPHAAAEYEGVIDAAMEETDTILRTFEAMLRIAQIEAGARRARFANVDLTDITENVVDAFAAVAEDEGKRLEAVVEKGVDVHGDRELLTQMLANLIENGIRHTPPGTALAVRLDRSAHLARLVVSDTGPGIPAEERERVFTRFYRLDSRVALEDNDPGLAVVIEFDSSVA
jgi:signal transduction histidine kinase